MPRVKFTSFLVLTVLWWYWSLPYLAAWVGRVADHSFVSAYLLLSFGIPLVLMPPIFVLTFLLKRML